MWLRRKSKVIPWRFFRYSQNITWLSVRGSHTTSKRGSLKAAWIWLVNVPGVKRPAIAVAPVWLANFRMARYKITSLVKFSQLYVAIIILQCLIRSGSQIVVLRFTSPQLHYAQGLKKFPSWCLSNWLIKPIFAWTQPIFSCTKKQVHLPGLSSMQEKWNSHI